MAGKDRIYLTGFMGSGKTTAGKKIADCLGWKFADLDSVIEEKCGLSIDEIFSKHGEEYFRREEARSLHEFDDSSEIVISTGGGAPCYGDNMSHMLSSGIVIYLKLTPEQLIARIRKPGPVRPLVKDLNDKQLLDFINSRLKEREKFYSRAHIIIEDIDPSIENICQKLKILNKG